MPHTENTVATALAGLRQEMLKAVADRKVTPLGPTRTPVLIGASKSQPKDVLEAAIRLGLEHFGENRVQEAAARWPGLKPAHPGVTLHLIGPLQSNKAKEAVALFDVIQTVDREKIAEAIANASEQQQRKPAVFIQVNTGEEAQKGGITPQMLEGLVRYCREQATLPLVGLMCIPPLAENPAPHFALMYKLAREHGLPELSMGMSGDFPAAIRFGATYIRIGTKLFGPRPA